MVSTPLKREILQLLDPESRVSTSLVLRSLVAQRPQGKWGMSCVCKQTHSDTFRQSRHMCLQADTFRHIQTEQTHVSASRHIQTHLDSADTCVCKQTHLDTFRQSRHILWGHLLLNTTRLSGCRQMQVEVGRCRQMQVDVDRCVSASRHIQTYLDRADICVCKQTHSDTFRQCRHMMAEQYENIFITYIYI